MTDGDRGHLLRVLGVAFGIAVVVGGTIGQGILRTPGLVAQGAPDPWLIIGLWVAGGLVSMIDSMSTVELAASIRETGGPYTFARRAFGPAAGLAIGVTDWLANIGSIAFVTVVFGEYMHRLGLMTAVPVGVLALSLIVILGGVQWLGTRVSGRSQEVGSAVKALLFTILIVVLLVWPRGEPVTTVSDTVLASGMTLAGLAVAFRGVYGTYAGWNSASYFCEEVRDPGRTIARATFSGIAVVAAIYVLVNLALLHVMSPAEMAGSNLAAADAAARIFGPAADPIVTAISLISLITIANVSIMIYPRVVFAMAKDYRVGVLTRVAANGTPRVALVVTVVSAALLASIGVYETLLAFSSSLLAAVGVVTNLSALAVRWKEPGLERPYRTPLFPLPTLFALAINLALLAVFVWEDPWTSLKAFALMAAVTAVVYLIARRTHHLPPDAAGMG